MEKKEEQFEILKQFVTERVFKVMYDNMNKIPERMERGLKLIYPEKKVEFLEMLLEICKNTHGDYLDLAFEVCEALDSGATIEEARNLLPKELGPIGQGIVRSYVLKISKRGPEYYFKTIPMPFANLSDEDKKYFFKIQNENTIYASREEENRERGSK